MKKIRQWLDRVYASRICNEFDAVVLVIGDEGMGKSTLIAELEFLYQDVRDLDRDGDAVLDSLVYDREGLQERFAKASPRSVIAVPDAARALHKKEAMSGDQVEIEKDFFDVRSAEYLVLLGYQDWSSVPTFLQDRRAHFALYVPRRGVVRGFSRESLDDKANMDPKKWPPSDLTDTFPSLDGTEFWSRYQELDDMKKSERMGSNDEEGGDDEESENDRLKRIAGEVKEQGVERFVVVNSANGRSYLNADLIEMEYDLSKRSAKKVKAWLEADPEVVIHQDDEDDEENTTDGATA